VQVYGSETGFTSGYHVPAFFCQRESQALER
jgi:hypothetical protein